jgi:hypothetical protein
MPTGQVIPSCEQILSAYLRLHADINPLVGDNVFTTTPKEPLTKMPMIRMTRIGGEPPMTRPLWLDRCWLQIDCYGGSKFETETLAHLTRLIICDEFPGTQGDAVICDVTAGSLQYQPDETFSPPIPCYLFDVMVTLHPIPA